ncbi:ferrochelatase [Arthrobacter sp.]|uniref:ferrochelatase n=1 Tax=Arthrobacter sp. TaxID=1667 RepID=UPI003A8F83E2
MRHLRYTEARNHVREEIPSTPASASIPPRSPRCSDERGRPRLRPAHRLRRRRADGPKPYDAILLASFGGPEGQEDVIPFLRNVTHGRGIPDERLEEVATTTAPTAASAPSTRRTALKASLEAELADRGIDIPVFWGNRNWDPYIPATLQGMYDAGHRRCSCSPPAPTPPTSCRQYREDLGVALRETGLEGKLEVDKVRSTSTTPASWTPSPRASPPAWPTCAPSSPPPGTRRTGADRLRHPLHPDLRRRGRRPARPGGHPETDVPAQHLAVGRAILAQVPEAAGLTLAGLPVPLRRPARAVAGT